jgi:hypothetical protein
MTSTKFTYWFALFCAAITMAPYVAHADYTETINRVFAEAHAAHTPLRNAQQAYLRLAGIVWIAVEWFAAFVLWRVYRLLKQRVDAHLKSAP